MKINENAILEDADKIFDLTRSPSYSKNSKYDEDLKMINLIYSYTHSKYFQLPGIYNPYYEKLFWRKYNKDYIEYEHLIKKYKDYYMRIARKGRSILEDNGLFYTVHNYKKRYSDEEVKGLLLDFFSEEGQYEYVKSLFDRERIGTAELDDSSCGGFCVKFLSDIHPYILISSENEKLNLQEIEYLAHELGHAIEIKSVLNRNSKFYSCKNLVLSELTSTLYEYEFLRYLQRNKINTKDVSTLINSRNMLILDYLKDLEETDAESIKDEAGVTYVSRDDDICVLDNKNIERVFVNEKTGEESYAEFMFFEPLIYGLGGWLALHLSELKNQDPKEFKKIWNNYLSMRTLMSYEDIIDMFGIDVEDLLSGKLVEPVIKKDFEVYTKQLKKQL